MTDRAPPPGDRPLVERLERQQAALVAIGCHWRSYEGDVDAAIRAIDETAARALDIDRVSVWFHDRESASIVCRDLYVAAQDKHSTGTMLYARDHPAYFTALENEEVIAADDANEDPRTRGFSESYFRQHDIGALLDAPIRSGGRVVGVLCHEHVGGPRRFHPDEINTAVYLASMLSAALEFQRRRESEYEVRQTLSLLRAAFEASGVGIVAVDAEGSINNHNKQYMDMWNMPEALVAHDADPEAVMEHFTGMAMDAQQMIRNYERFKTDPFYEYEQRMPLKDGRVFKTVSLPQRLDGEVIGRVWSFTDITDRVRLEDELRRMSYHDDLTGLDNRRSIEATLDKEISRTKRSGQPLSVAMMDIDRFKRINDTYGHTVGDDVLRNIGRDLQTRLRTTDSIGRWGGEEFLLVLFDTPLAGAVMVMEELRESIARERDGLPAFTVSVGVAQYREDMTADQLISAADDKLYQAKDAGRNRVAS